MAKIKLPHILIVEAPYYQHIADNLREGTVTALENKASYDIISTTGALEIPAVIAVAHETKKYDGYIALGCVIRGETTHYEIVSGESARGLMDLSIKKKIAVGNGILTVENEAQALKRSKTDELNKGGDAAKACLTMIEIFHQLKQVS